MLRSNILKLFLDFLCSHPNSYNHRFHTKSFWGTSCSSRADSVGETAFHKFVCVCVFYIISRVFMNRFCERSSWCTVAWYCTNHTHCPTLSHSHAHTHTHTQKAKGQRLLLFSLCLPNQCRPSLSPTHILSLCVSCTHSNTSCFALFPVDTYS